MSYWGDGVEDSDFAFGAVGASLSWIKDRLFKDAEVVLAKSHPEQGILASLCCLRVLGERFPKSLSVHFGRRELDQASVLFSRWCELMEGRLSHARISALKFAAEREFSLFRDHIEARKKGV